MPGVSIVPVETVSIAFVFATARKVGEDIRTITCKDLEYGKITRSDLMCVGLLLLK